MLVDDEKKKNKNSSSPFELTKIRETLKKTRMRMQIKRHVKYGHFSWNISLSLPLSRKYPTANDNQTRLIKFIPWRKSDIIDRAIAPDSV